MLCIVKRGSFLLDKMVELYGVRPEHEHYSCVVDMLSKAGKLDDSVNVIRRMPMKPRASVWGEGNEDEEDAAYVQLSYIYLASQRCDEARKVRKMIGDKGFKKTAGGSAIEVDGEVHEFVSGESSHPHLAKIHGILKCMSGDSSHDKGSLFHLK
ncbi:hypothetical protein Leryth_022761 [Lithospermum erythrorhizon]|nr:hypothetical protein Leryth_022761 [Lithospermum erythrorhizon]